MSKAISSASPSHVRIEVGPEQYTYHNVIAWILDEDACYCALIVRDGGVARVEDDWSGTIVFFDGPAPEQA